MKKLMTSAIVVTLAITFGVGSALAADRKKDQKRKGSCRSSYTTEVDDLTMAAIKKRDKKRDASCQNVVPAEGDELQLAANRKKDQKRNGSCRS